MHQMGRKQPPKLPDFSKFRTGQNTEGKSLCGSTGNGRYGTDGIDTAQTKSIAKECMKCLPVMGIQGDRMGQGILRNPDCRCRLIQSLIDSLPPLRDGTVGMERNVGSPDARVEGIFKGSDPAKESHKPVILHGCHT